MGRVQRSRTPVIVVGAGPVGLALGNELGWRGLQCMLVERSTELVDFPTCESINARTLEHMRRWGMAEAMREGLGTGWQGAIPPDVYRRFGQSHRTDMWGPLRYLLKAQVDVARRYGILAGRQA